MGRVRRVSASSPGWTRRRRGRGFSYADETGQPLSAEDVDRVKGLAIPPAWTDVWICPYPNGHLQAVGVDAAGRRQYLYHPDHRARQEERKFARVLEAARLLPRARRHVARDLALDGVPLETACATAVRLLDGGEFRVGSDVYADDNGSFGLTTLERRHVRRIGDTLVFEFVGKSGIEHRITVVDPEVVPVVDRMRRRRSGDRLLSWQQARRWRDLDAGQVNEYLADLFEGDFTAKDFRTWHGTVIAAEALALSEEPGDTAASRKRAIRAALQQVADRLGNTVAVVRSAYVDPRVLDRYERGETIAEVASKRHRSATARRDDLERAVLDLLAD